MALHRASSVYPTKRSGSATPFGPKYLRRGCNNIMTKMQGNRASTIAALILCLALVSCEAQIRSRVGGRGVVRKGNGLGLRPGEKIFNILKFGAKPDGRTDSTEAMMQAWVDACHSTGFARVLVPKGVFKISAVIFAGPCKCTSPIIFQLSGTLQADSDLSNYQEKGWIMFERVDGLTIMGLGTINGMGNNVWKYNDCSSNSDCVHLPASIYMNAVKNTKISGIHLVDSMGFHMHITQSFNVRMSGLKISAPETSPNTDGMHISHSSIVKVGRSVIRTGDDCISLGQGSNNVTISKIFCGPGHGISVGSLGKMPQEEDVTGVRVKNCTLTGTDNGIRIKTWPGSGPSQATNMLFTDIIMNNVKNPIIIDQGYGGKSSKPPSKVKISNVFYQNIRGTSTSPLAVNLMCSKSVPCENLHLTNINIRSSVRGAVSSSCNNAKVGFHGIQFPPACKLL